jgi:hypothetical protein
VYGGNIIRKGSSRFEVTSLAQKKGESVRFASDALFLVSLFGRHSFYFFLNRENIQKKIGIFCRGDHSQQHSRGPSTHPAERISLISMSR